MTIPVPVPVSQFPDSVLPLDGNELIPMVKNGVTVKAPSASLGALAGLLTPEETLIAGAGDNNNVDVSDARWLLVDTTAGPAALTGFAGGIAGLPLVVTNRGPELLELPESDSGSDPQNQIFGLPALTLPVGASQLLYYSGTLSKWVLV